MADHVVAATGEIGDGDRKTLELEGRDISVFNVDGEYYAYTNWCAHQSGPVCEGKLSGTTAAEFDRETLETTVDWVRDGEILCCPWHGWEYDVQTGDCLGRQGVRLISHDVTVENGDVVVSL